MKSFAVRQERDRLERRPLVRVAVAAAATFFAAIAAAGALLSHWSVPGAAAGAPSPSSTVERTLVRTTERGIEERRAERDALSRWGWVDRDAGIARMPIERAMDLIAADAGARP